MVRQDAFHCLEFDHEAIANEKIDACVANLPSLVLHPNWDLPGKPDAAERELEAKRFFVYRFEEPRTENAVHLDRSPDDLVSKAIEFRAWFAPNQILGDLGVLAVHSLPSAAERAHLLDTALLPDTA